jgi:TetR/AcrR family transcriptional repressor of nem operon
VIGIAFRREEVYRLKDSRRSNFVGDSAKAVIDAAERRMRVGGLGGFSFREIAADAGVKSSSVHSYFPTEDNLAAAVARPYTKAVSDLIDQRTEAESDPIRVWTQATREKVFSKGGMCLCTVSGATALDLSVEVAAEVQGLF